MTLYYCDFSNIIVQFEPLLIKPCQIIPFFVKESKLTMRRRKIGVLLFFIILSVPAESLSGNALQIYRIKTCFSISPSPVKFRIKEPAYLNVFLSSQLTSESKTSERNQKHGISI